MWIKFGALIGVTIIAATVYVYSGEKSPYSGHVDEWNSFENKTRAVTDIGNYISELNDAEQSREISVLLSAIFAELDLDRLNGKDKERLCRLYDRYSLVDAYRSCQRDILISGYEPEDVKAWIRALKRQLSLNATADDNLGLYEIVDEKLGFLSGKLNTYSNTDLLTALNAIDPTLLDSRDRYQVAKTLLDNRFRESGAIDTLRSIVDSSDNQTLVSKAYFVLARHYLDIEQYDKALTTYSGYIARFGDSQEFEFFVNKAYQRILQIQVAAEGDGSGSEGSPSDYARSKLIEFVSDANDLRTYFDTARKLVYTGFHREAMKVFDLGLKKIENENTSELTLYQQVRLYAEVIRTGNRLGIDFARHEKYIRAADQTLEFGLSDAISENEEMAYLYSQYLLWAAEAYVIHNKPRLAENYYGRFVARFRDSPDYEFAVYKLLETCSISRQCHKDKTVNTTAPTEDGYIAEQVLGTFSELADVVEKPSWKGEIQKWLDHAG